MTYTDLVLAQQQRKSSMAQTIMTGSASVASLALASMALAGGIPGENAELDIGYTVRVQAASQMGSSSIFTASIVPADLIGEARLVEKLVQVHANLVENQSVLDAESQKILFENLHNMYL